MRKISVIFLLIQVVLGFPTIEIDPKVVGGRDAIEHEAPYIVSLEVDWQSNGVFRHICGGSILTSTWILSAAHCITEVGLNLNYQIVAGQHDLSVTSGSEQIRAVTEILIHENFVSGPIVGPFDITVLRLASPLTIIAGVVEGINLPLAGQITLGSATLFGWGSTSTTTTPSFPNILQTVTKPIIAWDLCREIVNAAFDHEPLHSSNLCTGLESNYAACNG